MSRVYDVCVIGSGGGGGATAAALAEAGKKVLVLEKGPWFDPRTFYKDEVIQSRRYTLVPDPRDEPMVEQSADAGMMGAGQQSATFWNGSLVGGSSVLMSGFFTRLKPDDFKVRSTYGAPPPDQEISAVDWPIAYEELEPWYDRVEKLLGVSGRIDPRFPATLRDGRSSPGFPQPPTPEHPFADELTRAGRKLGLHPTPLPRAVLSQDLRARKKCDDNGFCGYSVCTTNAKGSSLAEWIPRALATGNCEVRPHAMVFALQTDEAGTSVRTAQYHDGEGTIQTVGARAFVVACQAIETARLLLNSKSAKHPHGLANGSGLVGRNLLFATYGAGWGDFPYGKDLDRRAWLRDKRPFINRIVQDFYWYDPQRPMEVNAGNTAARPGMTQGGTINFLLPHPYPIGAAINQSFEDHDLARDPQRRPRPLWGEPLKKRLHYWFQEQSALKFEVFGVWYPHAGAHTSIDASVRDKWGVPVSRVRAINHQWGQWSASFLASQGVRILREMGAVRPRTVRRYGGPSTNLIGGTCRFGDDPKTSVLNRDCRAHEVQNLYVSDASFMPSGGRVPFTFTIYANALRVAAAIAKTV